MRQRAHNQDGFTLVEVIVAMFVLLVGILGVLSLLTGALQSTAGNNERVGATNLARELVEVTRGLEYEDLTTNLVTTRLQSRGVLGSGSPWTIDRRGVTYTITQSTCAYDDPADGYGASAPQNACTARVAGADSNGDDFRRTTFAIAWTDARGKAKTASQSTLIVNPSGGLGPRITCFTPVTQTFAPAAPGAPGACPADPFVAASDATRARIVWTTTFAQSLHWEADDGRVSSSGDITGAVNSTGGKTFTTVWDIGNAALGDKSEILDGTYVITGQAFDDRGIAGEARRANVELNRRIPYAPTSLQGGFNTRLGIVDLRWDRNQERDILGYRVMWAGPNGTVESAGGDDVQVCPTAATGSFVSPTTQTCADFSPPSSAAATRYYVVAIDRSPAGATRPGDPRPLAVSAATAAPDAPRMRSTPIETTPGGLPRLNWNPPVSAGVSFYRIYRDMSGGDPAVAVEYADRHDRTTNAETSYTDSPGDVASHQYWITAVDSAYNESAPLGPITWTRP